jgi:hypothetical protein
MTTGQFRGKQLFAGRLFAGRLFGPDEAEDPADGEDDPASPFTHRRRSWRPLPVEQLPPPKRKRKRRQADILFLGH